MGVVVEGGLPGLPVRFGSGGDVCPGLDEGFHLGAEECLEWFGEVARDVAVVFDSNAGEEGLVELAAYGVRSRQVGRLRVGDEVEGAVEVVLNQGVALLCGSEALVNLVELAADAVLLASELVEIDGSGVVGLEELGALGKESPSARFESAALAGGSLAEGDELVREHCCERVPFGLREYVEGVVRFDLPFDGFDEDGLEGAVGTLLVASGADEIGVDLPCVAARVGDDQAATALAADDAAFEVVVMDTLFLSGVIVGGEHVLDALPGLGSDERLVTSGVLDTAVADDALVVGVFE